MSKKKYEEEMERIKNTDYTEEDIVKVLDNESKIRQITKKGPLAEYGENIAMFFSMLKDYHKREYKELPKGTIVVLVGTLLYIISPIDLVPDAIPVAGLLDDAAMLAICIGLVAMDVKKYKAWKENQGLLGDSDLEE